MSSISKYIRWAALAAVVFFTLLLLVSVVFHVSTIWAREDTVLFLLALFLLWYGLLWHRRIRTWRSRSSDHANQP